MSTAASVTGLATIWDTAIAIMALHLHTVTSPETGVLLTVDRLAILTVCRGASTENTACFDFLLLIAVVGVKIISCYFISCLK